MVCAICSATIHNTGESRNPAVLEPEPDTGLHRYDVKSF